MEDEGPVTEAGRRLVTDKKHNGEIITCPLTLILLVWVIYAGLRIYGWRGRAGQSRIRENGRSNVRTGGMGGRRHEFTCVCLKFLLFSPFSCVISLFSCVLRHFRLEILWRGRDKGGG